MTRLQSNQHHLLLLALLLLMGLGGCAQPVREEAEEELWPELDEQTQGCTAISGRYSARPRIHGKSESLDTPLLAYALLPASAKLESADKIELAVTGEELSVTAFAGEQPLLSHSYQAESGIFECIDGNVEFRPGMKPQTDDTTAVTGIDWETIRMRRTVDGSLLLQEADGLASLAFMLFPIYFTTEHWYQFKPAE